MNKIHYCLVGEPQMRFGVFVTGAGYENTDPGEPYPHPYHSSDYYFTWERGRSLADFEYQLLYIRSGTGVIEFERDKAIRIGVGDAIILHPGEWHRYRPDPKTGWGEAYVGIGGDFLSRMLCPPFFSNPPTIVHVEAHERFNRDIMALVDEIQRLGAERPYYLAMKTLMLMTSLFETRSGEIGKAKNYADIRIATLHLAHHLDEDVDLPALAAKVGLGYPLFRKKFHAYTDMAPLEYLVALRIRRACNLLQSSSIPIAKIARDTGFKTPAYFSRFFRAKMGQSPIEFRNTHLNDCH